MKKLIITTLLIISALTVSAQWDPIPWYMPRYFTNGIDTLTVSASDSTLQLTTTEDTFYIAGNELVYIPRLATDSLISNFIEALNIKVDSIMAGYVNRADTAGHLENWDTTTINNKLIDSLARVDDTLADHRTDINTKITVAEAGSQINDSSNILRSEWSTDFNTLEDSLDGGFFTITDTTKSTVTNTGSNYALGMSDGRVTRDTLIDIQDSIFIWIHDTAGAQINDSLARINDSISALRDDIGTGGVDWLVMSDSTTGKGIDTVYQFNLDTNTYHLKMDTATTIDWTGGNQGDRYIFMLYQDNIGGRELYFMPGKWQSEYGILNISTGSNDTNVISGYHTGNKVILSIIQNAEGL